MSTILGTNTATVFIVVWTIAVFCFGFLHGRAVESAKPLHLHLEQED